MANHSKFLSTSPTGPCRRTSAYYVRHKIPFCEHLRLLCVLQYFSSDLILSSCHTASHHWCLGAHLLDTTRHDLLLVLWTTNHRTRSFIQHPNLSG